MAWLVWSDYVIPSDRQKRFARCWSFLKDRQNPIRSPKYSVNHTLPFGIRLDHTDKPLKTCDRAIAGTQVFGELLGLRIGSALRYFPLKSAYQIFPSTLL